MFKSRSKSALSHRELDSSRTFDHKRSGSTGPSDKKKWGLHLQKSKQQLNDPSLNKKYNDLTKDSNLHIGSKSTTKFLNDMQSKSGIWHKMRDDKKKKLTLSNMDLKMRENNDVRERDRPDLKSCLCGPRSSMADVTRWDHLVIMLVCAIFLAFLLSTPLSILFRRAS